MARETAIIIIRYEPKIKDRPDIDEETARNLWRDSISRDADQIAERGTGAEVEAYYLTEL